jgi:TATA-box binding protein (TBP) (component of TFIID and TFIIIB)
MTQVFETNVDIQKKINSFKQDLFSLCEASHELSKEYPIFSHLKLSTMTMLCDLKCEINLEQLTNHFTSPSFPLCSMKKAKTNKEVIVTKRGKKKKSFYNCTTITYKTFTTKSVKVFSNGTLQITGVTSLSEALKTINIIINILKLSGESIISGEPTITNMKKLSVEMINSNFNFKKEIDLKQLRTIMKNQNFDVTYDPDTYPGINAKINNISVFIFGTGNIVITGAKSLKCIENTIKIISNLLIGNPRVHLKEGKGMKTEKRPVTYTNGYHENLYNALCTDKLS